MSDLPPELEALQTVPEREPGEDPEAYRARLDAHMTKLCAVARDYLDREVPDWRQSDHPMAALLLLREASE